MSKVNILITGGNSGIGFETASLLARTSPSYHVIISARNASKAATALDQIRSHAKYPSTPVVGTLSSIELDVTSDATIAAAPAALSAVLGPEGRLDVLVNNAGIFEPVDLLAANPNADSRDRALFRDVFEINVYGPYLLTQTLSPLLRRDSKDGSVSARVINVTSSMGSIALRFDPAAQGYGLEVDAYRMSKAALNMMTACYAVRLAPTVKVFSYCPGYVATNLGGAGGVDTMVESGAGDPATSGKGILDIIQGNRDADSQVVVTREGGTFPW